jgi:hypothetical protein
MKVTLISLVAALLVAACLSVASVAQTTPMAASTTKAVAHTKIPNVKLPYTFVCKHCGLKITVKTAADWLKPCPVCPCGTLTVDCLPTKK